MTRATHTTTTSLAALLALALAACGAPAPQNRPAAAPLTRITYDLPTAVIRSTPPAFGAEPPVGRAIPPTLTPESYAAISSEPPTLTPEPPTLTPEPYAAISPEPYAAISPEPPTLTPEPYAAISPEMRVPQRIIVGSIGLDRGLVSVGLDAADFPVVPDHDVAWYNRSARPGGGDNVVVWGHALRFRNAPDLAAPLERMKLASVGDSVQIVTADGASFAYVIREQVWARPDEVGYILPKGVELLTIVNCIGDIVITDGEIDMSHRLITIADPLF
jgi:hypothetical protein